MQELIQDVFVRAFQNPMLASLHDGATWPVENGTLAFTTDSYVVRPLFFPGGDIGSLAVTKRLLDAGADPNLRLLSGESALMVAARGGFAPVIDALLVLHAVPSILGDYGENQRFRAELDAVLLATAPQIAAGEATEHRRLARLAAFALQGQEDLFHRIGHAPFPL